MKIKTTIIKPFQGTEGNDLLDNSFNTNFIYSGSSSKSHIHPKPAPPVDQTITGTPGNDNLKGGAGNDTINGLAGNDKLSGNAGNDTIDGGDGDDTLSGGGGNDVLIGGIGKDKIAGDAGDDFISGGDGKDDLDGGIGDDTINGGNDNDVIKGGDGADQISGDRGNDTLTGGKGHDTFLFNEEIVIVDVDPFTAIRTADGNDCVTDFKGLGAGNTPQNITEYDTLQFTEITAHPEFAPPVPMAIDFTAKKMILTTVGCDLKITFEDVPDFSVTLKNFQLQNLENFTTYKNIIFADEIEGVDSYDVVNCNIRDLTLTASYAPVVFMNDLNNKVIGRDSADIINAQGGNDKVFGLKDNDTLRGEAGNDWLIGGDGDDRLNGGDGDDVLVGGDLQSMTQTVIKTPLGNDDSHKDVAIFRGKESEYDITRVDDHKVIIKDKVACRDGTDVLYDVEFAQFSDNKVAILSQPALPPTAIDLTDNSVPENMVPDTVVGILSGTDPDTPNASLTFALLSEELDNDKFTIVGNELRTSESFDYEAAHDYNVKVRVTDPEGNFFDETLPVVVTNVNEAPYDIKLFGSPGDGHTVPMTVQEDLLPQDAIGTVYGLDPDVGDVVSFTITPDAENPDHPGDNANFVISGSNLRVIIPLDFEAHPTGYDVMVKVTDQGGLSFNQLLHVDVSDSDVAINGTDGDDTLLSQFEDNTIDGKGGNDTVSYALFYNSPFIPFGPIGVHINLANGTAEKATGLTDTLVSIESVIGSAGSDTIVGTLGDDTLIGGPSLDFGLDTVDYSGGAAVGVNLGSGSAVGQGNDTLVNIEGVIGSNDDDFMVGSSMLNVLEGGLGNDSLSGGDINGTEFNNDENDFASYEHLTLPDGATQGVTVDLSNTSQQDTINAGFDTLKFIEYLRGSKYDDTLTGDNDLNQIWGGAGDDTIHGGNSDDILRGEAGNDEMYGDAGNDEIYGSANDLIIDGGAGNEDRFIVDTANNTFDFTTPGAAPAMSGIEIIDLISQDNTDNTHLILDEASVLAISSNAPLYIRGSDLDGTLLEVSGSWTEGPKGVLGPNGHAFDVYTSGPAILNVDVDLTFHPI